MKGMRLLATYLCRPNVKIRKLFYDDPIAVKYGQYKLNGELIVEITYNIFRYVTKIILAIVLSSSLHLNSNKYLQT